MYLASHDAEGSLGFVINRPTGSVVGDLVPGNEDLSSLENVPVYVGGPVAQDRLTIAILATGEMGRRFMFRPNVSALEAAAIAEGPGVKLRAFIGYSGWGEGQLSRELEGNSWIVRGATPEVLEASFSDDAWRTIVGGLSPWHRLAVDMPDDPSLN